MNLSWIENIPLSPTLRWSSQISETVDLVLRDGFERGFGSVLEFSGILGLTGTLGEWG
jgi:hypothetical protein